jgi:hypothetical protein
MTTATSPLPRFGLREFFTPDRIEGYVSFLIGIWVTGLLVFGWINRSNKSINPENGWGYALGIIGGSMMLLLLFYPFRKRIKFLRNTGSVGFWFRFHMLLGLLGPIAVLYHARFSWGALNSAVALNAMLIVAGSGLIGRFFYARVHRGYSGRKLEVRALLNEMHELETSMERLGPIGMTVKSYLAPYEVAAVSAGSSFWNSAAAVIKLGVDTRLSQSKIRREIASIRPTSGLNNGEVREVRREVLARTAAYFIAVRRAGEFAFYDRMLRLWHILHLPLFFILIATAILHIVAVHMY